MSVPRVWIGGWRHVEHLDPTKAHTGALTYSFKQRAREDNIKKVFFLMVGPLRRVFRILSRGRGDWGEINSLVEAK